MLRHRFAAAAISLSLLSLAACGDDSDSGSQALDGVTIKAESGKAPEVEFDEKLEPDKLESDVLVEGDGEETADGDVVTAYLWVGNGFSKEEVYSTHTSGAGEPEQVPLSNDMVPGLKKALIGQKVGSTVAVIAPAEDAFGEMGNPQLGLGNGDSVLFITEIVSKLSDKEVADLKAEEEKAQKEAAATEKKLAKAIKNAPKAASGTTVEPAAWAPGVTYPKGTGKVPVFDFKGVPKPSGKLQVTTLIDGKGPKVKSGQTLIVHYVGQVFGAGEPFDSSYSRNEPATFPIGVGQVVQGWDEALVGQKVGSRVIVQIPPKLGYGEGGNEGAGIKGTDTIVFAVDILGAV